MGSRTCVSLLAVAVAMFAPDRGAAQSPTRQIELGEARSFRSEILNEDRQVQIALPETYSRTTISYPVLFVLDGSSHLLHGRESSSPSSSRSYGVTQRLRKRTR